MYKRYRIVNKTNDTVGDAWFSTLENCYIAYVPQLDVYDNFDEFKEMEDFFNKFNLDVIERKS